MVKVYSILLAVTAIIAISVDARAGDYELRRKLLFKNEMDPFRLDEDVCQNGVNEDGSPQLGPCDLLQFPACRMDEGYCLNRKPSRDEFHDDHVPKFYIQYDRILCFPKAWACSSCTPGRFCRTEKRCILEDIGYPCEEWL